MNDLEEMFDTPMIQYQKVKKAFLQEFLDPAAWGEQASQKQLVAITRFLQYLQETKDLAALYPSLLEGQVSVDNRNMVVKRILPLPLKLYEEILWNIVADEEQGNCFQQSPEETLAKVENFLIKKQRSCILINESEMWGKVHDFDSYTKPSDEIFTRLDANTQDASVKDEMRNSLICKLRRLRSKVYSKARASKNVKKHIIKYQKEVHNFLQRFHEDLNYDEICAWESKIAATIQDAEKIINQKKTPKACLNSENKGEKNFESVKIQEYLLEHLPDVPSEIDANIEERLIKLKFFSQVWDSTTLASPSDTLDVTKATTSDTLDITMANTSDTLGFTKATTSETHGISKVITSETMDITMGTTCDTLGSNMPTNSLFETTEQNRLDFNSWYYKKIEKNSNNDVRKAEPSQSIPSQHKVACSYVTGKNDEGMDTGSDKVFPVGLTNVVSLEVVLVMFITLLNLLNEKSLNNSVFIPVQAAPCSFSRLPNSKIQTTVSALPETSSERVWQLVRSWSSRLALEIGYFFGGSGRRVSDLKHVDWNWVDKNLIRDSSWY